MEHYEKGEKLGQGQFGIVIKARHKEVTGACHVGSLMRCELAMPMADVQNAVKY